MTAEGDRIRRASYYVWFLGQEEYMGLRGPDLIKPAVQYLIGREREQEPKKITLQVTSRGIKFLQQISSSSRSSSVAKHFVPASALTWVQQEASPNDDIVSAVVLIYNPQTGCPVHVQIYRCDSTETAQMLRNHLSQLVQRPQHQAKLSALEARLTSWDNLPSSNRGSDRASTGSSISSGGGSASGGRGTSGERMAVLYDSLAAELREKLVVNRQIPILFPPKDYDTTLTRKPRGGPLDNRKTHEDDSARSSGIGSDDTPSPIHDREFGQIDGQQSSSDEEWAAHESAEVSRDSDLLHSHWRIKPSLAHSSHPQALSPSPRRSRKQTSSSPHTRKPNKNLSPIRMGHHRAAPPPRRGRRLSRDRSESPVSPRERFHDARDKFLSLERDRERRTPGHDTSIRTHESFNRGHHESSRRTHESSGLRNYQDGIGRSPSWKLNSRAGVTPSSSRYYPHESRKNREYRESRELKEITNRENNREYGRNYKRESYSSREDLLWPKSDRDTGYGSRDGLLREKRGTRDWDKGYGTYDTRDSEGWKKDGNRTPDMWERRTPERSLSPLRGRTRSPNRDSRVSKIKSSERQEYHRAKSMHDLSHRKSITEEDSRRRSMYDTLDNQSSLRDARKSAHHFHSHANLPRPASSCSSRSDSTTSGRGYNELPENQRFPGLDRATARPDPLDQPLMRSATTGGIGKSLKTYDYPVNGGCAPIQISRTHHDDYRRFRYDHQTPQFVRSTSVPAAQY